MEDQTMKKLVSNMANLASTIRIKALCLAALAVLTGVNGETMAYTWPTQPSGVQANIANPGANHKYFETAQSGLWSETGTWESTPPVAADYNARINSGGALVRVKSGHTLTINVDNIFIAAIVLEENAHLVIAASGVVLHGNGTQNYPIYAEGGSSITINRGKKLINEKGLLAIGKFAIYNGNGDGDDGELEVQRYFESVTATDTITTNCKVTITNGGDYNFTPTLVIDGGTFVNNRGKRNTPKSIIVNGGIYDTKAASTLSGKLTVNGGKYVSSYNTTCSTLTLSGGEIEIASGATLKSNDRILSVDIPKVNSSDTISGSGILDVTTINVATGDTLTIDGNITLNQNVTINGIVRISHDVTLTNPLTVNGTLIVETGKTLNINGDKNITFGANSTIIGGGTLNFKGNSTINGLTDCAAVSVTNAGSGTVSYATTSTHIISGTYNHLTLYADFDGDTKILCGDVTVNGTFTPKNNIIYQPF